MEKRTLSVREVAEILDIAPNSVRAGMKRGEIPYIQIGRRMLVTKSALAKLLGEQALNQGAA